MTDSNLTSASLTGRDLVLSILRHEPTGRPAWVPFAGVHAGKLKGYTARQVLTSADCLFESLLEVNRLYRPDGQPVMFDLQVEAEILGCELAWAEDSPPSVATHPLTSLAEIPTRIPTEKDGRLPLILDVMRRMKAAVGQTTALYGLVTGPFTLASHLRGTDLFLDLVDQPDRAAALLACTELVAEQMARLYIAAGMDVIAVVDPMISQISPRHFQRLMLQPFSRLFHFIREQGAASAFFVCGDATRNIQGMCQTGPDSIAVDENVDFAAAKQITAASRIVLQGNIPLTSCLLLGSQQDNMKYVVDLLNRVDPDGLIVSPGCDMPYATPPENVIGAAEAIRDPERIRLLLSNYQSPQVDDSQVTLPDYSSLPRPLIEVFTLDSTACAACGYMLAAASRAAAALPGRVDLVEYRITRPENIARMKRMGIRNLPAILINGELKFNSIIPSQPELLAALQPYLKD
jgi:uroporphyrinogen decarboxylase